MKPGEGFNFFLGVIALLTIVALVIMALTALGNYVIWPHHGHPVTTCGRSGVLTELRVSGGEDINGNAQPGLVKVVCGDGRVIIR